MRQRHPLQHDDRYGGVVEGGQGPAQGAQAQQVRHAVGAADGRELVAHLVGDSVPEVSALEAADEVGGEAGSGDTPQAIPIDIARDVAIGVERLPSQHAHQEIPFSVARASGHDR